jgi:hypothetical protein
MRHSREITLREHQTKKQGPRAEGVGIAGIGTAELHMRELA